MLNSPLTYYICIAFFPPPPDCSVDDEIRLVNGSTSFEGRVEVCFNNTYRPVCGVGWDSADAAVVCSSIDGGPFYGLC